MNVVLCCDERAKGIGPFATSCSEIVLEIFKKFDATIQQIESADLNPEHIYNQVTAINNAAFIFTAFSHGTKDSLIAHLHGDYISTSRNEKIFGGSFFYTWACSSGSNLCQILKLNNCKVYIGYTNQVYAPDVVDDSYNTFVECATSGLKYFLQGHTAVESFNYMKNLYENKIRELRDDDIIGAIHLSKSNRYLYIDGTDLNCTFKDFLLN